MGVHTDIILVMLALKINNNLKKIINMVKETFIVENDDRMNKVKTFIRQNMPTARFIQNPYRYSNGKWDFYISYESSDLNKLSKILEEFYLEDNPPPPKKVTLIEKFLKWVRKSK